jgi:lipid-binding SYLF domain-containing protein
MSRNDNAVTRSTANGFILKTQQLNPTVRMNRRILILLTITTLALPAFAGLFGPKGDNVKEKQAKVRKDRDEILAKLYAAHPEARDKIKNAAGYGTFNNKNMNLFLLSTGHGYGVVVDNKTGRETFMAMGSLGGGVGLGAKDLSVVFIYKDAEVMKEFIESGWQFGGEASATAKAGDKGGGAAKEGAVDTGANVFEVYQLTDTGVALQATVAGTKYWKDKKLND